MKMHGEFDISDNDNIDDQFKPPIWHQSESLADWKYTRIYNPQGRLRILVERCRKDSSQHDLDHWTTKTCLYLSTTECCRVSAADKGWRVYPLDPRFDAVVLYSGYTPRKRRVRFLPVDRHTASLVGLHGGWRHARRKSSSRL
ncbi:hypothetical protein TNCV_532811 [Trichonephila clavipes]|nr:hypothetical protein TNCV_532811 [Trichonephila clavipes]